MPCVENFQALVSVDGMYLEEFKIRYKYNSDSNDDARHSGRTRSGVMVDSLVESPQGMTYKLIFGAIDPLKQQTDWIVYVLIDGILCGSRVLIKSPTVSSCQVSGASLSHKGEGPLLLTGKDERGVHLTQELPPVPGSIRVLVYRGTATLTDEPSLFNYPSWVCPFVFVDNYNASQCHGLQHVTGYAADLIEVQKAPETYAFTSIDPTSAPWITIDYYYRYDTQLAEQLAVEPVAPRAVRPPSPPVEALRSVQAAKRPVPTYRRVRELGGVPRKGVRAGSDSGGPVYASSVRTKVTSDQSSPTSPSFPSPGYSSVPPLSFTYDLHSTPSGPVVPSISGRPSTSIARAPLVRPLNTVARPALQLGPHSAPVSPLGVIAPLPIRRSPFGARDTNVVPQIESEASRMESAPFRANKAPAFGAWARPRRNVPEVKYEEEVDEYVIRAVSPASNARVRGNGGGRGAGPATKKARKGEPANGVATGRAAVGSGR